MTRCLRRLPFTAILFIVLLCLLLIPGSRGVLVAKELSSPDQAEIQTVIERQLGAFARDDAGTAFSIASPMIQRLFGTAANFMAMVRAAYPQVYRHHRAEFGEMATVKGEWLQFVRFTGTDGHKALALYTMTKDAKGSWRIIGCRLLQRGEAGA
jgi:hypothetical protein